MTKDVYIPDKQVPFWQTVSPVGLARLLYKHRELIRAYADREYQATHRNTLLGATWAMLTPLIMLALFTFVFGFIFKGRFNTSVQESPVDFALALFVGLSVYNCIAAALTASPTLMFSNATYVKTLAFPLEVISVAQTYNIIRNLLISLGLCLAAFLLVKGYVQWTIVFLVLHIAIIAMLVLGTSWLLSAVGVFVPDTPAVTNPISMVLMFLSGVFFSINNLPPHLRIFFKINPLAVLIEEARGALLYGRIPDFRLLVPIAVFSAVFMMLGYYVFVRSKAAFSDVM